MARVASALGLTTVLATGCVGEIGSRPAGEGEQPIHCTDGAAHPGPSPIRRLTRADYDNTVRDLLGDTTRPATAFPLEEEQYGFNNNANVLTVSLLLAEQYEQAAEDLSTVAVQDLTTLLPCDPATAGEDDCARSFIETFGKRAYRRPLSDAEIERTFAFYGSMKAAYGFVTAVRLVIKGLLQSPDFLYRVELGMPSPSDAGAVALSQHELASRLSYLLWNSMPDDELFALADAGQLSTPAAIAAQARRMLDDDRARPALTNFHRQWLQLGQVDSLEKDPTLYPNFDPTVRALMRTETERFLEGVVLEGDAMLETLLRADYSYMNKSLADFYGVAGPLGDEFEKVALDPDKFSGLLTQASVLAVHAKANQTSPVKRGYFVRQRLFCQTPPPPPNDVDTTPPEIDPNATTREKFAQHTNDATCAGCHVLMDPIGFGFERYDAVGLWRETDHGLPIDDSGEIVMTEADDGVFHGVIELGERLAQSAEVRACLVTQWFRFAHGRSETTEDRCTMDSLVERFTASGGDIRELLVALTQTDAFLYRSDGSEGGAP
jgi:hypothetical protein